MTTVRLLRRCIRACALRRKKYDVAPNGLGYSFVRVDVDLDSMEIVDVGNDEYIARFRATEVDPT